MFKKVICLTAALTCLTALPSFGQDRVYLKGRVIDGNNQPVQGAQARLIKANKTQTTGNDGRYSFETIVTSVIRKEVFPDMITIQDGVLSVRLYGVRTSVRAEVFRVNGRKIRSLVQDLPEGIGTCTILSEGLPESVYLVKLNIAGKTAVFKIMNSKSRSYLSADDGLNLERSFLKQAGTASTATIDSLEISKNGYQTVKQAVRSYNADLPDIVIKSNTTNDQGLPPVTNGKQGKTTRYWDCCKPHCGWYSNMKMCDITGNELGDKNAKSGCEGGPAFQCMDYAPIEINSKVSYGWAAFNNSGTQCGDCYQLDFQGSASGKQMIVQVINIGDGGGDAFDLLIPGGGVGAMNGCSRQWNNAPLGQQYGGFLATCGANKDCVSGMCQKAFGDKADLMRGCNWFINWFGMANNPPVMFAKVSCPQKIKDISRIGN